MPRRVSSTLVATALVALVLTACASPAGEPEWHGIARDALETALTETGIPGGSLTLTIDGETWTTTSGDADVESGTALDAGDLLGYRSITKSFTVTAILQLVDEGLLSLDDPISDYVDGVPRGDEITLRMLAGMRSGLANYSATAGMQEALGEDLTQPWTDDELLALALAEPLGFEPGTSYEYSNTNTLLLGETVRSVTGMTWEDAVAASLLEPEGMASVVYPDNSVPQGPLALPYQAHGQDAEPELVPFLPASALSAAGGLFGTIEDLGRWARVLGSGDTLSAATAAERVAPDSLSDPTTDPSSPHYDAYGLGIGVLDGWIGHTGTGIGYQALAMYDPDTGDSIAILLNGTGDDPDAPAAVFETILDSLR